MKLGEPVAGFFLERWRFVEQDMHHIDERIREFDPDARLAHDPEANRWAVVRHVQLPVLGDTWIIGFVIRDADGTPLEREPDGRVMHQMRKYDTWRQDNPQRTLVAGAKRIAAAYEREQERLMREKNGQLAESVLYWGRRAYGLKKRIYVPADLAG